LHCETRIHDTSYPSGGHRLVGPAWVSDLNRLRKNSEISSVSRLGWPVSRRAQPQTQTFPLDCRSRPHHRKGQSWAPSDRVRPL